MNTPNFLYRTVFGNAINFALKYGTFMKLGVKSYRWINLSSVKLKSQDKRQDDLHRIEKAFSSSRYRNPTLAPTTRSQTPPVWQSLIVKLSSDDKDG
jgi:hypothetical protein